MVFVGKESRLDYILPLTIEEYNNKILRYIKHKTKWKLKTSS